MKAQSVVLVVLGTLLAAVVTGGGIFVYLDTHPPKRAPRPNAHPQHLKALFIGNSFTYVNDLPKTLATITASMGDTLEYDSSASGGATLADQTKNKTTVAKIAAKPWDAVVLQEQSQRPAWPTAQVDTDVAPYAAWLAKTAVSEHAKVRIVFFETWGYQNGDTLNCTNVPEVCTYDGMQSRIAATIDRLAEASSAEASPVGEAWGIVLHEHPEINLYGPDGIHPSPDGTYLAACVFYESLFKNDVSNADAVGIPESRAVILRKAAHSAVQTYRAFKKVSH